jgi:hypothetical protein
MRVSRKAAGAIVPVVKQVIAQQEAEAAAAASVAARKKRIEDSNRSYAERMRAAALNPTGMKKGGAVKKKTVAKPMVKAKARKK